MRLARLCRRLGALRADHRGIAAVEFALVSPILFFVVMATVELGYTTLARSALEAAVRDAARRGSVEDYNRTDVDEEGESVVTCVSQQDRVSNVVNNAMRFFLLAEGETMDIATTVYESFGDVDEPEPFTDQNSNGQYDAGEPYTDVNGNAAHDDDIGAAGLGGPGDVVEYEVTFPLRALFGTVLPRLMGQEIDENDGTYILRATTVTRNQSFFGFVCA